jgi:hypothetical protein
VIKTQYFYQNLLSVTFSLPKSNQKSRIFQRQFLKITSRKNSYSYYFKTTVELFSMFRPDGFPEITPIEFRILTYQKIIPRLLLMKDSGEFQFPLVLKANV